VRYSLQLGIDNGSDALKGSLTVTFSEKRPKVTSDDEEIHTESKAFPISFQRDAGVLQQDQSDECKAVVDGQ